MAIQVVRNVEGNIVEFRGSSQPIYWNGALSAIISPLSSDRLDIINLVQSTNAAAVSGRSYEFYQMPFTEFTDSNEDSFPSALSAVEYINTQANATTLTVDDNSGYVGFITKYYNFDNSNPVQFLSSDIFQPIVADVSTYYDENILSAQGIANGSLTRNVIYSSNEFLSAILPQSVTLGNNNGAVDGGTNGLDADGNITSSSKPVFFSQAGHTDGSFDSFRIVMNVTPEENESALDLRIRYITNIDTQTSSTLSSFELTRRTLTFTEGAGVSYTHQENFSFYAADTLKDTDAENPSWDNSGFYFIEARPNADMEFELLGMTQFANK